MTRAEMLARIASLSEEEFAQVRPYLEADLEAAETERRELADEIRLGQESARSEPLHDHDSVMAEAQAQLSKHS